MSTQITDSPFLAVCRGERPSRTPVWFMRQAGRSLPEYRVLRDGVDMMTACRTPELVAEITMQPVRRHGVDAAILFSDIVVPLAAVGIDLDIVGGVGPVIADPIRSDADLERLRPLQPDDVTPIAEAVRLLVAELDVPLIGFAGAPFTLASYLIEGGPSRHHERTKALMYDNPELWHGLLARLAAISAAFLTEQIRNGAQAIQLFDSWVGALPAADYIRYVQPYSAAVLAAVSQVPRIHFGVGTAELLPAMAAAGADVIGVDYRLSLTTAAQRVPGMALQGNLDPAALFASWPALRDRVDMVLQDAAAAGTGHIFNLGHGVLPTTDPDALTRVVEHVHATSVGGSPTGR
jgi:uroporphyrinogen decarboxylase